MRLDNERALLLGVCAGVGRHLDIDPVFIRIAFFCAFWFFGVGVLAYFILAILMSR
jgi:phage shock protein PspC (stress-responsive transcriptional regulator)